MKLLGSCLMIASSILLVSCGEPIAAPGAKITYTGTLEGNENVVDSLVEYCKVNKCHSFKSGIPVSGVQSFFMWIRPSENEQLLVSDIIEKELIQFMWTQVEPGKISSDSQLFLTFLKEKNFKFKVSHSETWTCDPGKPLSFECKKKDTVYEPGVDLIHMLNNQ